MRKVINEYEIHENKTEEKEKKGTIDPEDAVTLSTTVGCLRGLMLGLVSLAVTVSGTLAVWSKSGFFMGVFAGVCLLIVCGGFTIYWTSSVKKLTIWDCLFPLPIGLVSAVVFTPVALLANGSFFSAVTCMAASFFLTVILFLYRSKKIEGKYLIWPFLVFVYEILPIELPTEFDNWLAFGGNIINAIAGMAFHEIVELQLKNKMGNLPNYSDKKEDDE